MDEARLASALEKLVGAQLSKEIASDFIKTRMDYASKTLERPSAGKFVETFVQCLQQLDRGSFDKKPNVDQYLDKEVEKTKLDEGLRICAARIARSMYTLRNKRNVAHKNDIDPNGYDLSFVHMGASWITAELLRHATGIKMEEAGALIELIQAPVGTLVEEIDGVRIVHGDFGAKEQILILLHSHFPHRVSAEQMESSLFDLKAASLRARLSELRKVKLIVGDGAGGFRLTMPGYNEAVTLIRS
jgi:hypothetical protein